MSWFHYQAGDSVWKDPVGYALGGGSGPYQPTTNETSITNMADADWADYQQNIQPQQQKLLDYATNPNTIKNNVSAAEGDVNAQFANVPGAVTRQLAGQGITMTPDQTASFNRTNQLNKGVAQVDAANQTRAATVKAQSQALGI